MKSSTRCLSQATCLTLALFLISAPRLNAGQLLLVTDMDPSATVIPFTNDGYLSGLGAGGAYFNPSEDVINPPGIPTLGFPSPSNFGAIAVNPGDLGRTFKYYNDPLSGSGSINNDVTFQDVSLEPITVHTDLYIVTDATSQFGNFSNAGSHPASWGEALVLTSPDNVAPQMELVFATALQRVGMFFTGNAGTNQSFYTLDAYDEDDNLIESVTAGDAPGTPAQAGFLGYENLTTPIGRIVVRETNSSGVTDNDNVNTPYFDDIRYEIFDQVVDPPGPIEIPEPSTLLLASVGLLGFVARRRRKAC